MDTCFQAKQSVELVVPPADQPIEAYLRQSARIVQAIGSSGSVISLGDELFQLQLKPLRFLSLTIQPIVDMRVWTTPDDCLHIKSVNSEILGLEQFDNPQFMLNLIGKLQPTVVRCKTRLRGEVQLMVKVEMPMPIALTPKPILETTGNTIMSGVLSSMKQRLKRNLIHDYKAWNAAEANATLVNLR